MMACSKQADTIGSSQIVIPEVSAFPQHPKPYVYLDWKQRARSYDAFVYDWSNEDSLNKDGTKDGVHFSTILKDELPQQFHKMAAYYGDQRIYALAKQEAINNIASVVGASLVGINKSDQDDNNYVKNQIMFKNTEIEFTIIRRNAADRPFKDWWYDTLPSVLFYMLADLYPNQTEIQEPLEGVADEFYDMLQDLSALPEGLDFFHQAFDHKTDTTFDNNHVAPEAGIMAGLTEYWAYKKFGKEKYLGGAKMCMDYFDTLERNPYYEIGVMFAPYLAARMNVEEGTDYDIERYFNWTIKGSDVRPGWGTMTENWNGYDVHGVQGSRTDTNGYGFLMNTFSTAFFAPMVKYDYRYANVVGKWLLSTSNAARFFYADQMPVDKQYHGNTYVSQPEKVIGYEGLRKSEDLSYSPLYAAGTIHSPSVTGDPQKYGKNWNLSPLTTNLGLYGSSWVGFFGGIFEKTNIPEILQIDLNVLDFYSEPAHPTYLYYNPYSEDKSVEIDIISESDIYDAISDSYIVKSVKGNVSFSVAAENSVILIVVPKNSIKTSRDGKTFIDNKFVRYDSRAK